MSQPVASVHQSAITSHALPDIAGLIKLENAQGETAVISRYGAQLLSWKNADGRELLYCSPIPAEQIKAEAAIRGGVPICFPQFSNRGNLPKHGLVRNVVWDSSDVISGPDQDTASARLQLSDSPATRTLWPHHFDVQVTIQLSPGTISIALDVHNNGSSGFDFTVALHTYLATSDLTLCSIDGLAGSHFIDSARGHSAVADAQVQTEAALRIHDEHDRIYLSSPASLQLQQNDRPYLQLEQQGFLDSVVWNPGAEKAAQLGDMPAQDWRHMLCIEAAQIAQPVQLQPGEHWRGLQRLIYQK